MKPSRVVVAAVGVLVAGACAPVTLGAGPGYSRAVGAGAGWQLSHCSGLAAYSPEAARMGIRSPAIRMGAIRNQITQIQMRVSFGQAAAGSREGWKRIASGEC